MRVLRLTIACGLLPVASAVLDASLAEPSTAACAGTCDGQEQNPVALMQLKSQVKRGSGLVERINSAPSPAQRASLLKPVAWLHPMKCGSSLFNVLVGLDSLWSECPADVRLDPADEKQQTKDTLSAVLEQCTGVFGEIPPSCDDPQCWWGGHMSIGTIYDLNKGHFVAFFRQPEQLLLSGYNELHAWFGEKPPKNAVEYATALQGCQTKMLARDDLLSPCRSDFPLPPTAAEVNLALQRLREGFAWVGITDKWDLSVCTFHAKFGGACLPSDLQNVNPGVNKTSSSYDTSVLHGFTDKADGQIFSEVEAMMGEDMARYGVSVASCTTWCW